MDVRQLNEDQLLELKSEYFDNHRDEYGMIGDCCFYWELDDELIFDEYAGVYFVMDDFFCTAYVPEPEYDSPENIKKCLNCEKADCDNCLKTINGV